MQCPDTMISIPSQAYIMPNLDVKQYNSVLRIQTSLCLGLPDGIYLLCSTIIYPVLVKSLILFKAQVMQVDTLQSTKQDSHFQHQSDY